MTQSLILTNQRVVLISSEKLLDFRVSTLPYSSVNHTEQQLAKLVILGSGVDLEYSGKHMHELGRAIQQLKADPNSFETVKGTLEALKPDEKSLGERFVRAFLITGGLFLAFIVLLFYFGIQKNKEVLFGEPEQLSIYTDQCEKAFIKNEKIETIQNHQILNSRYHEALPENNWNFKLDGSQIVITGEIQARFIIFKKDKQLKVGYFYCGIDRKTQEINYLNFNGYERDVFLDACSLIIFNYTCKQDM